MPQAVSSARLNVKVSEREAPAATACMQVSSQQHASNGNAGGTGRSLKQRQPSEQQAASSRNSCQRVHRQRAQQAASSHRHRAAAVSSRRCEVCRQLAHQHLLSVTQLLELPLQRCALLNVLACKGGGAWCGGRRAG